MNKLQLNKMIDHTLLKPQSSKEEILKLCEEAKAHDFKSVCVNPFWVSTCKKALEGSDVLVCTVIGFPLGANTTQCKVDETKDAVANGALEVDMVLNVGLIKSKDFDAAKEDIAQVAKAAHDGNALLKVILETCLLTKEEIAQACLLAKEAGADFVKTSTGFSTAGAKVEDVELMRQTVGEEMGVKASGGIRDWKTAQEMIAAGANRLGVSAGIAIMEEYKKK